MDEIIDERCLVMHANYKRLLETCKEPKTLVWLKRSEKVLSEDTVRRYCEFLVSKGYMAKTRLGTGYQKIQYQALKPEYPLELIVKYSFKAKLFQEQEPTLPGAKMVTFTSKAMENKLKDSQKIYNKDKVRAREKVSVSGSSLLAFV
jgi:hypothetical protein